MKNDFKLVGFVCIHYELWLSLNKKVKFSHIKVFSIVDTIEYIFTKINNLHILQGNEIY